MGYLDLVYSRSKKPQSDLPTEARSFNETIGWPLHPVTGAPHELLGYQIDMIRYPGKDLLVVKSNKVGATEAILRDMVMKATVGDCRRYQLMLGAQGLELAIENMRRLQDIFFTNPILASRVAERRRTRLVLKDGTTFMTMPRRAASIRGWPRLKYAFLDEAAHYGLLDDEEFYSATLSRLTNTEGYLRIVSTPRGQRGFFYRLFVEALEGRAHTKIMQLPYHVAFGKLISEEFIEQAKAKLGPLFAQEYECTFLSDQNAAIPASTINRAEADMPPPEEW